MPSDIYNAMTPVLKVISAFKSSSTIEKTITLITDRLGAKWDLIVVRVPKGLRCLMGRGTQTNHRNTILKEI